MTVIVVVYIRLEVWREHIPLIDSRSQSLNVAKTVSRGEMYRLEITRCEALHTMK